MDSEFARPPTGLDEAVEAAQAVARWADPSDLRRIIQAAAPHLLAHAHAWWMEGLVDRAPNRGAALGELSGLSREHLDRMCAVLGRGTTNASMSDEDVMQSLVRAIRGRSRRRELAGVQHG